jgi:hypothetical protein
LNQHIKYATILPEATVSGFPFYRISSINIEPSVGEKAGGCAPHGSPAETEGFPTDMLKPQKTLEPDMFIGSLCSLVAEDEDFQPVYQVLQRIALISLKIIFLLAVASIFGSSGESLSLKINCFEEKRMDRYWSSNMKRN